MKLKLRQIVLVAADKADIVDTFRRALDVRPVHGSGNLAPYGLPAWGPMSEFGRQYFAKAGLENLLFAVGSDFIEVMFPTRPDSQVSGFMERRGGDTGYMLILQTDEENIGRYLELAKDEGVRVVQEERIPTESEARYHDVHFHPRDCGGTLLSIAAQLPERRPNGPWFPAGEIWESLAASSAVSAIVGAEIRTSEPIPLAERWSRLLDLPFDVEGTIARIRLEDGELRFAPTEGDQKDGFWGFDLRVKDRTELEAGPAANGTAVAADTLVIGGMTIRLVD